MPPNYETVLFAGYADAEVEEIRVLMEGWAMGTYTSIAHSIVDHAERHGFQGDYLKYLRKARSFKKKGASKSSCLMGQPDGTKGYIFDCARWENSLLWRELNNGEPQQCCHGSYPTFNAAD